ncbi:hypothetical protein J3R30DRAFT_3403153 [Lentinula aciculospora]|uniref:Uncharacterized protein n=1 Tax=Lentinula aciculospora TaxID=153920 RepID=A0A9W9DR85_9AGAR|nr:hypothetical protein J3R30DRAFT_3403153 [Lentinula aciculospora]
MTFSLSSSSRSLAMVSMFLVALLGPVVSSPLPGSGGSKGAQMGGGSEIAQMWRQEAAQPTHTASVHLWDDNSRSPWLVFKGEGLNLWVVRAIWTPYEKFLLEEGRTNFEQTGTWTSLGELRVPKETQDITDYITEIPSQLDTSLKDDAHAANLLFMRRAMTFVIAKTKMTCTDKENIKLEELLGRPVQRIDNRIVYKGASF